MMFMKKHSVAILVIACLVFTTLGLLLLPKTVIQTASESEKFEQGISGQPGEKTQRPVDISKDRQVSEYLHKKLISDPQQTWESTKSFQEVGEELLRSYEERGDSIPMFSGYLDVLGNVWSCIFQGSGWVDICLVSDEGSSRKVAVCHVTTQEIQEIASQE